MSRIGKFEWAIIYIVAAAVDIVESIFPPAIVLDFFFGPILLIYFQWLRGVDMLGHPSRIVSLLAFWAGNSASWLIEPYWIFDIWIIHTSVRAEDTQFAQDQKQQELLKNQPVPPTYQDGSRQPPSIPSSSPQPRNTNGIRAPRRGPPSLPPPIPKK